MGKPFTCPGCGAVHDPDTCESKFTGEQAPPPPPAADPPAATQPPTTAPPAGAVPVVVDETDELFAPWKGEP